jgi:hypothetical protein
MLAGKSTCLASGIFYPPGVRYVSVSLQGPAFARAAAMCTAAGWDGSTSVKAGLFWTYDRIATGSRRYAPHVLALAADAPALSDDNADAGKSVRLLL